MQRKTEFNRTVLRVQPNETPDLNLSRLYAETMNRLSTLRRRVQEGRDVMAASEFARWLIFSGMVELFKAHSQDGFHKVDGSLLASKTEMLLDMCNERFRTGKQDVQIEKQEMESLRDKVDTIAGYLAKLTIAPNVVLLPTAPKPAEPLELTVLDDPRVAVAARPARAALPPAANPALKD